MHASEVPSVQLFKDSDVIGVSLGGGYSIQDANEDACARMQKSRDRFAECSSLQEEFTQVSTTFA
jgi:prefoldin subunit 5